MYRGRGAPKALVAANQMLESGNYKEAADRFEAIARTVESRGGSRAPQFHLQAGRARILAGQNETGLAHLKHGLSLFVQRSAWPHLHRAGNRVVAELRKHGLTDEVNEISEWMRENLPANFDSVHYAAPVKKTVLPTHCPSCGAVVLPDEVDWLDDITAECAYCGSPIREDS
jgi:hypothetical protein